MSECSHRTLTLLKQRGDRLRCKECHLVISADELRGGHCPECYVVRGEKRFDFETLAPREDEITRYRCEECGALIEWQALGEDTDRT